MSDATCGVVSRRSTSRCGRGISRRNLLEERAHHAASGASAAAVRDRRATARASLFTALFGSGIEPCPGVPSNVARTQQMPFSATWIG